MSCHLTSPYIKCRENVGRKLICDWRPTLSLPREKYSQPGENPEYDSHDPLDDQYETETELDLVAEGDELRNDASEAYDPFSQYLTLALGTGITTAEQSGTAMKLKRRTIEDVAMNEKYMTSSNCLKFSTV